MPNAIRLDLEATGLKAKRPELFEASEQRLRIRVHDLRGVFVTVNLANGRSEAWISDRTGHRSSQMINRYRRLARTFEELNLGELAPLDDAMPELKAAKPSVLLQAEVGREWARLRQLLPTLCSHPARFLRWAIQDLNLKPTD